jgi:acyl-CoA thioesterase I
MLKQRLHLISLLVLLLLCYAACVPDLSPTTHVTPTAQPTRKLETKSDKLQQPVSAQKLLSDPAVYVAMGASDALGVGCEKPGSQGYVPLIGGKLPAGSRTINLGVDGIHLHQALKQELPQALSAQPQLVTIWLVANDFTAGTLDDDYMQDLQNLLKQLRMKTRARVVMANLPDLSLLPSYARLSADDQKRMRQSIEHWNARMGQIATRYQVTMVDLYSRGSEITAHPQYISSDGFHPSAAGYSRLAYYFWSGISRDSA